VFKLFKDKIIFYFVYLHHISPNGNKKFYKDPLHLAPAIPLGVVDAGQEDHTPEIIN